jgi:hypothetical protein
MMLMLAVSLAVCGWGRKAEALAVEDYIVSEANPVMAGYALNWDYVYSYRDATAVAVDHYWILTAAHVADDVSSHTHSNLTINGETYSQQEVVFHPSADLALVRYDRPLPGYYSLFSGGVYKYEIGSSLPGLVDGQTVKSYSELILVGFGYAGAVTNDSFTSASPWGVKRWGTNRGDLTDYEAKLYVGDASGVRRTTCFHVEFNLGDTTYEAGANVFDSGGPYFIEESGEWKVAGINLLREGDNPYTGNYAAQLSEYVDWVTNTIADYDSDMDGLPDWWERSTGETEAGEDPDHDGFTNYEEWIADTMPDDSHSYLQVWGLTHATEIIFNSSTGRTYEVQYCDGLTDSNAIWQVHPGLDAIAPTSTQTVQAVSASGTQCFYRVHVTRY